LLKIWPIFGLFFIFQDFAFLKLLMAKFGLFNFFGPGNPVPRVREKSEGVRQKFKVANENVIKCLIIYYQGVREQKKVGNPWFRK